MSENSIEHFLLRALARPYLRLLALSHRKPFLLSPLIWTLGLFASLALAFGLAETSLGLWLFVLPGATALLCLSALASWRYLKRPSDRPIVFFTRFDAATGLGRDVAIDHLEALGERLRGDSVLVEKFDMREIPEVLTFDQGRLLLGEAPAAAVIFGSVRAVDDSARWALEMLLSWPLAGNSVTNVRTVGPKELSAQSFSRTSAPAPRHEQFVEADVELRRLASEVFETEHADRALGTLLVRAGVAERSDLAEMRRCFERAQPFRAAVSTQTRAAWSLAAILAEPGDDLEQLVTELEAAGEGDADHVDLWNVVVSFSFLRYISEEIRAERHLAYAQRAVQSGPEDAIAHYNLGEAQMSAGDPDAALAEFESLLADSEYANRPYLHLGIGVIHYNHTHEYEKARDAYRRAVELLPSPQAHLYLADTHRVLGEFEAALKHYREALLGDPTLVDAHRGHWAVAKESGIVPIKPGTWDWLVQRLGSKHLRVRRALRPLYRRLLFYRYRHHPEDSRIHYMLGAAALLVGDYAEAEERLRYADELVDGHDLEAQARLALAVGLQGRIEEACSLVEGIRDAKVPEIAGGPDLSPQGRVAMTILPVADEPRLLQRPHADELFEAIRETFGIPLQDGP